jgi:DNA-binding MarR family transcriptional regulator
MVASPPVPAGGASDSGNTGGSQAGTREGSATGTGAGARTGTGTTRRTAAGALGTVELADRLHSAAIHLLRGLRRTDTQTGISAAQLSVLSVLMGGPRSVGELAAAEQVQVPTMSKLLRDMEAARLVRRERDDEDRRVVRVAWTARGASALRHGRELRISRLSREVAALPATDQRVLADALGIVERLSSALLSDN